MQESMRLKYEPASDPLHIYVKWLLQVFVAHPPMLVDAQPSMTIAWSARNHTHTHSHTHTHTQRERDRERHRQTHIQTQTHTHDHRVVSLTQPLDSPSQQ